MKSALALFLSVSMFGLANTAVYAQKNITSSVTYKMYYFLFYA